MNGRGCFKARYTGRLTLRLIAAAAVIVSGAAACGDAIIVLGDSPGLMRIVAGTPDSPGDSLGGTATRSLLSTPLGLAADGASTLYIADRQNARVLEVKSSGEVRALVDHSGGTTGPRLREPAGLALSATELFIADPRGNRVWSVDLETLEATPIAGTGAGGDSPDGTPALQADLDEPTGVAVGPDGLVYFSETGNHRVRRILRNGIIVTFAGIGIAGSSGDGLPATQARFNRPTDLTFGPDVLYIADTRNHKVRSVDLADDRAATVAGLGVRGFGGDGELASEARLDNPAAVAVSSDGANLFIADTGNHRIRAVNLATGRISTFAGTGETEFNGDLQGAGQTALFEPQGLVNSPLDFLFIADSGHHVVWRTAIGFLVSGSLTR